MAMHEQIRGRCPTHGGTHPEACLWCHLQRHAEGEHPISARQQDLLHWSLANNRPLSPAEDAQWRSWQLNVQYQ